MKHTDELDDPVATIRARVKELRARKGWSASDLAKRLVKKGILWNRSVVANFESGRRPTVSVPEWLALARVLDVSPLHLLIQPEGPGEKGDASYNVTSDDAVTRDAARAWVRGMTALPDTDLRIFFSEMPAEEWGNIWALAKNPADVDPDARFNEPGKWLRRAYGGYGNPDVIGGDDG
ncbi:helix-turn-helix domain-containing protein [Streptomyces chiangmaiensis]|uniref:Helix-turn-helix transcriptional regulator n=1 Tax=Streptomyces chiangmaiensis TaxID=766497 RepID=A0ABU7FRR3_9ACTN|nr:helix-turn-helix transcriptional regulator [Streptomyces chiangmaiensis]MED7826811.1 helix-turn-helix transcriptional regulator [Streptomyces chiangmaiensis]